MIKYYQHAIENHCHKVKQVISTEFKQIAYCLGLIHTDEGKKCSGFYSQPFLKPYCLFYHLLHMP